MSEAIEPELQTQPEIQQGRPTKYTKRLANEICTRLIEGMSLREICRLPGIPDKATVCRWLATKPDFRDQYAHARNMQAEMMADEMLDIADDGRNDWVERTYGDTVVEVVNQEAVQRSKLRVDTRKWIASKMLPKKFGERVGLEHSGPDGGPIKHDHSVEQMSNEQIAERLAKLTGFAPASFLGGAAGSNEADGGSTAAA